ncbi:MAG TPA: TonB C-terminal domain-containing protein [Steroidobacteraceae bacterium]|nr:TonB C-terminal domain-containing protein [Steroidobacteraceae bacterium]
MRAGPCLFVVALSFAAGAHAQRGPNAAYPINTASPPPPLMQFEQKDRETQVAVRVGADGRVISTKLVTRSGNGVYDERVRGFWKKQPFVPALDADGRPRESTVLTRATFLVKPAPVAAGLVYSSNGYHFRSEAIGKDPEAIAQRLRRMTCADVLWEYDFMRALAPKAKLVHEEIFHVSFAMYIADRALATDSRDALIAQWETLMGQVLDSCRAQPAAPYFADAFKHVFDSAAPVGVNVR